MTESVYRQTIKWTVPGQGVVSVAGPLSETPAQALKAAKNLASIMGWTRPRWWQWWRLRDGRYDAP